MNATTYENETRELTLDELDAVNGGLLGHAGIGPAAPLPLELGHIWHGPVPFDPHRVQPLMSATLGA